MEAGAVKERRWWVVGWGSPSAGRHDHVLKGGDGARVDQDDGWVGVEQATLACL